MNCNNTHKLVIKTLGSQVTRQWIKLSDGTQEADAGVLASLEAGITNTKCGVGTHTPDGAQYTGATPVILGQTVESLTLTVRTGQVTVTTPTGSMTVFPRESFSWGSGDVNLLDASALTFTGNANALYRLHWENV